MNSTKLFRKLINLGDALSIFLENITGKNIKRKLLEAKQDLESLESMENTIGKALNKKVRTNDK